MKKTLSILLSVIMTVTVFIPALSVTAFGYSETSDDSRFDSEMATLAASIDTLSVYGELREYLREQMKLCNETINISQYCIDATDSEDIEILQAIIYYDLIDMFHCSQSFSYYYNQTTNYITKLIIDYTMTKDEYDEAIGLCDEVAESFIFDLKNNTSLSEAEKALLVHDRLVQWCEYDYVNYLNGSIPDVSYNMYGALANGIAVCSGYAKAYKYTLNKLGIECSLCDSDTLAHEWNIVTVDGVKYHVDTTWDDPTWDVYGRVKHTNFLRSTNGIVATGHEASDFDTSPVSTTYDSYYWQSSEAEFQYKNGMLYYFDTEDKMLKTYSNGTSENVLSITDKWKPSATSYYPTGFVRLDSDADGNYLFYSVPGSIYKYDLETETSSVFYTPSFPGSYYWIYGFKAQNNYLYLDIYNSPNFAQGVRDTYGIKYKYRDEPAIQHDVIYNYSENGGTGASVSTLSVAENGNIDLSVTAQKNGWTFIGWNTDPYAHAPIGSLQMGTEDITLYAIYSKTITATFIDYSGTQKTTSTITNEIFNKQNSVNITLPAQNSMTGWNKAGWAIGTQATASAAASSQTLTQNITFYGLYTKDYTVSYELNGGSGSSAALTFSEKFNSYGHHLYPSVLIQSEPTRKGYTFSGWFDGDGNVFIPSSTITLDRDINLSAEWSVNSYTVYFDENCPNGSTISRTVEFGTSVGELPAVPERTGFIFDGWYTEIDAGVKISDNAVLENDDDTTFYAHWVHDDFIVNQSAPYTVDTENYLIYGENIFSLTSAELLSLFDNENISVEMNGPADRVHTGIQVKLTDDCGEVYSVMTVVVFGDVNGDGWYDGTDAITVKMFANRLLTESDTSAARYMAADCNHDGVIDRLDVEILEQAGLLLDDIDQSRSNDELVETSSSYVQYLNLISQTAEAEEIVEEPVNATANLLSGIISMIKDFIEIIKSAIAFIKADLPGLPFSVKNKI